MAIALDHFDPRAATRSILAWPRHDLAAKVIVAHQDFSSGSDSQILPDIAEVLDHEKPHAATIRYRILRDGTLACARSNAYWHGENHLAVLECFAPRADSAPDRPNGLDTHSTYRAHLRGVRGVRGGSQVSDRCSRAVSNARNHKQRWATAYLVQHVEAYVTDLMEQGAPAFEAAVPILSQLLKAELAEREVRSIAYHMNPAYSPKSDRSGCVRLKVL